MRSPFKIQKWIILLLSIICGATFFSYAAQIDGSLEPNNKRIVLRTALVKALNLTSNHFLDEEPWIDCIFDREATDYKQPYSQAIEDITNQLFKILHTPKDKRSRLNIEKLFGIDERLLESLGQRLHQKYWKLDFAKTQTGEIRIELTLAKEKGENAYLLGLIIPTCVEDLWPAQKLSLRALGNSFAEAMHIIFAKLDIK